MALIEFREVSKRYPGASGPAVDRLNLQVQAGEFLSLLGPSGSGKTTCLMMLAGFEPVSEGSILLDGQPIEQLPPHRRGMGVVFQSYSLFPHLTVAGNVAFPLQMRKRPASEVGPRVQQALARVRLEEFAARRPNQLSGGQQQRVALARALVFEPRLVLMDEPLAALDKKLREEMQLEIRRLHRELGVTMVYVTHDQGEAMTLSDRVAVFNHGRIEQIDRPERLYEAPGSVFVAGFVGDNNALVGAVVAAPVAAGAGAGEVSVQVGALPGVLAGRRAAGEARVGAPATLCIRPERLRLGGGAGLQSLPARVLDLIHQGDHWRLVVAPEGGASGAVPWLVKLPPGAVPEGLAPGVAVQLGFHPGDAWVFT